MMSVSLARIAVMAIVGRSNTSTDLPLTVWGHALDYLRYSEARNALLVSKTMASEVPKHVHTLNVFAAAEMHARTARRFANCTEVNILCLVVKDQDHPGYIALVEDVVRRVVPFLTFFPKLKKAFAGGACNGFGAYNDSPTMEYTTRFFYARLACRSPDNHQSLYRFLVQAIVGMYETSAVMPRMKIGGIRSGINACWTEDACACRKVCETFPFGAVLPSSSDQSNFTDDLLLESFSCLPINERVEIIKRRSGGSNYLRSLSSNLEACLTSFSWIFRHKDSQTVHYLKKHQVQYIERLIECGCDPSSLVRGKVVEGIKKEYDNMPVVAKTTVDRLVAWGFPVVEGDFRIIDATTDPSWKSKRYDCLRE